MWGFRFLLVVLLAALVDVSSPVLPEAGEAFEELQETAQEEMAHGRCRGSALVHGPSPASTPAVCTPVLVVAAPRPLCPRPPARATTAPVRRIVSPLPDSASASDSH